MKFGTVKEHNDRYVVFKRTNCNISSKKSFAIYDFPSTCFDFYYTVIRKAAYQGTQIQHILLNMCLCRITTQYYQLKLLKKFKMSIINVLHFLIFYLPLPINIDISYCHQHSKGDIPLLLVDACHGELLYNYKFYCQIFVFILINIMLAILCTSVDQHGASG